MPESSAKTPACKLAVKVVPGASRSGIAGWHGGALRVRVTARPERGKANVAVETLIAETLGLAKGAARIISGKTSVHKVLAITGLSRADMLHRIKTD